jgi:cytosine/adenosine deaminase-related metal-dependent hydrolase
MFTEMRTAALIQKAIHGAETLPALQVLRMSTIDGARAMSLGDEIGSIEGGKRADLILINLDRLHTTPHPDPVSTIVYAAETNDIETVFIDGSIVMRAGELTTLDESTVIEKATKESSRLSKREN